MLIWLQCGVCAAGLTTVFCARDSPVSMWMLITLTTIENSNGLIVATKARCAVCVASMACSFIKQNRRHTTPGINSGGLQPCRIQQELGHYHSATCTHLNSIAELFADEGLYVKRLAH